MEILKHGNIEQRKLVCSNCGCVFAAGPGDQMMFNRDIIECPDCNQLTDWCSGEPYDGAKEA